VLGPEIAAADPLQDADSARRQQAQRPEQRVIEIAESTPSRNTRSKVSWSMLSRLTEGLACRASARESPGRDRVSDGARLRCGLRASCFLFSAMGS
jgi:hypothetical protein